MEYRAYKDVPDSELKLWTGRKIAEYARRMNHVTVDIIKNGLHDHIVHHPEKELDEDVEYKIYHYDRVAGSGICYEWIAIYKNNKQITL